MEFKIKNRHRLKKKEVCELIDKLKSNFNNNLFNTNSVFETGFYKNIQFIFINNKPYFMFYKDRIVFTIIGLYKYKYNYKKIIIDMEAVKFITKGADLMIPGIIDVDENIQSSDIVCICDEKNKKPLALGIAVISGEEIIKKEKGKAVTIFHYIGDNFWDLLKKDFRE